MKKYLALALLAFAVSGCSFPDAGIWRTIAYTKIAESQADAGDMRGARESAALALESAWHLGSEETADWARAAAVAARVHTGDVAGAQALALRIEEDWRDEPGLSLYFLILAQLERGDGDGARRSLELSRTAEATGDVSSELKLSTFALVELGDFAVALDLIADDDPKNRAELILSIALKQARDGAADAALESLEEAREIREASETQWTMDLGENDLIFQVARAITGRGIRLFPPILRDLRVFRGEHLDLYHDTYLLLHIAAAQARRGEDEAALEIIDQMTGTGRRAEALAWVAAALADGGELAAGRGFANRALALLPDIEPGHEEVSVWVFYALARTGGTEPALSKTAEVFDQASKETVSGWSAMALAQGQVGDLYGMHESIDKARENLDIVIANKKPEQAADDLNNATANWAWIMAIGGDVPGALTMAERIPEQDERAFALVPAVTWLAETGNWSSALEVAKGMRRDREENHVMELVLSLGDQLRQEKEKAEVGGQESDPKPWYERNALNLELLRTLSSSPLPEPSGGEPPIVVEDLQSLAEATRDHGLRARLFAWAAELWGTADELDEAKTAIGIALATALEETDPYAQALALIEVAHAQAVLGAEDAALATLDKVSDLVPDIRSNS